MNKLKTYGIAILIPATIALLACVLFFVSKKSWPPSHLLCQWDCGWYKSVLDNGYVFIANEQCNVAFFPLLPMVRSLLGTNELGVSFFNFVVFCIGIGLLIKFYNLSFKVVVVFCCAGLVTFFMVPYTESLFFLGSAIALIGFDKKHFGLTGLGLLISIATRSASMIFLVALGILFILEWLRQSSLMKRSIAIIIYSAVVVALVTGGILYYQFSVTGEPWGFFKAHNQWAHYFRLPKFPLTGWHWPVPLTESVALVVGIIAMVVLSVFALPLFFKQFKTTLIIVSSSLSIAQLFSFLYLAGGTSFILLYQGGSLGSLNRYIFSTPFFLIFVHSFISGQIQIKINWKYLLLIALLLTFIMPHSYLEHLLLVFLSLLLFIPIIILQPTHPKWKVYFTIACIAGVILQSVLLSQFLQSRWMG